MGMVRARVSTGIVIERRLVRRMSVVQYGDG